MKFVRIIVAIFVVQLAQDAHGQIAVSGTVVSDESGDALPAERLSLGAHPSGR